MVEGATTAKKQSSSSNKSFTDQYQTKIVLRHLPPTLTSEQFLEMVSPLPDHDYYRFCKADLSLGQQYSFSRAYLNIPNRQDLIVFTEKFQGYIFLDKNGNEYACTVEYAPNQAKPKSDAQARKDPKLNSIEQDPDYQNFVANMNAPASGADALPNAEAMLEEIEKKQKDSHDTRNKSGTTTTPLLEYLRRKREDRKQEKLIRIQQSQQQQRRNNKILARNQGSNINDDSRPSTGRTTNDDEYGASSRYGSGTSDRSYRHQQRGYDKGDYRMSNHEQKRSNPHDHHGSKSSKQQHSKGKQSQQNPPKESKLVNSPKPKFEETATAPAEAPPKRDTASNEGANHNHESNPSDDRSNKAGSAGSQKNPTKNRPSIQIYNPSERIRLRRQQNPSSQN